jgi:hypothetical protein
MKQQYLCVDKKFDNDWRKQWRSMSEDPEVVSYKELKKTLADETIEPICLLIIHSSAIVVEEHKDLINEIYKSKEIPYIMWINSDSYLTRETSPDGRVHYSGIPFPGNKDLSHLSKKFQELLTALSAIPRGRDINDEATIKQRKKAWDGWEGIDNELTLLPALSILCQGYLAIYAGKKKLEHAGSFAGELKNSILFTALEQMGWFGVDKKKITALINNESDQRFEEILSPEWWNIFDDGVTFPDLSARLLRECKGNIPPEISALLHAIESNTVDVGQVAAGYCSIMECIKNHPQYLY